MLMLVLLVPVLMPLRETAPMPSPPPPVVVMRVLRHHLPRTLNIFHLDWTHIRIHPKPHLGPSFVASALPLAQAKISIPTFTLELTLTQLLAPTSGPSP